MTKITKSTAAKKTASSDLLNLSLLSRCHARHPKAIASALKH
jgi:hypothetical protein